MARKMAIVEAKVLLFLTGKKFLKNFWDYNQEQALLVVNKRVINPFKRL
jgi:hypothetical protein